MADKSVETKAFMDIKRYFHSDAEVEEWLVWLESMQKAHPTVIITIEAVQFTE